MNRDEKIVKLKLDVIFKRMFDTEHAFVNKKLSHLANKKVSQL